MSDYFEHPLPASGEVPVHSTPGVPEPSASELLSGVRVRELGDWALDTYFGDLDGGDAWQ